MTQDQLEFLLRNMQLNERGQLVPGLSSVAPPPGMDALGRPLNEVKTRRETLAEKLGLRPQTMAGQGVNLLEDIGEGVHQQTFVDPGKALADATENPTPATLANVPARFALALAPFKPAAAMRGLAGSMAAGLGTAGLLDAKDALPPLASEAQAADDPLKVINGQIADVEKKLNDRNISRAARQALQQNYEALVASRTRLTERPALDKMDATRATQQAQEQRQNDARAKFLKLIDEYDQDAKPSRTMDVIKTLGPLAPAAAAAVSGSALRLAAPRMNMAPPSFMKQTAVGLLPAVTAANAQPIASMINEPTYNPVRSAYEKASLGLFEEDPLKAVYEQKAQALPTTNPKRQATLDEITDPRIMLPRLGLSALEATAAPLGYELTAALARTRQAPADLARMMGEVPPALAEGFLTGVDRVKNRARASAANARPRNSLLDDVEPPPNRMSQTANPPAPGPTIPANTVREETLPPPPAPPVQPGSRPGPTTLFVDDRTASLSRPQKTSIGAAYKAALESGLKPEAITTGILQQNGLKIKADDTLVQQHIEALNALMKARGPKGRMQALKDAGLIAVPATATGLLYDPES